MNQAFYNGLLIRIKGGQYTLDEIDQVIDKAAGKGFFGSSFDTVTEELKALARQFVDTEYKGNIEPRSYDHLQDIEIEANSLTLLELYETVLMLQEQVKVLKTGVN